MANSGDVDGRRLALGHWIAQQIEARPDQRITFAEYMDWALYHPQYGYYATKALDIGPKGDFFTSPHLGADFGELLAEQFVQVWQGMNCPDRFTLVEMGAGQGILAADILRYLNQKHPAFYQCLEYKIVEKAAPLIAEQQRQLQPLTATGIALHWCALEEIPPNTVVGCFFSNELVDALPVHLITIDAGQLQEIYVTASKAADSTVAFSEVVAEPSTPKLAEYFDLVQLQFPAPRYPDRYRSEVNLIALDWIKTVADRLQQGYVITIDYGYPSDRFYSPVRAQGTLQCYYQHAHHSNPYLYVGQQDITAHADFTALERQGERCGLRTICFTQQGLFLMALGLGERIAALSQSEATRGEAIQAVLRRREALHMLVNPMGLGNFGVLIQSKGIEADVPLPKGLSIPQ